MPWRWGSAAAGGASRHVLDAATQLADDGRTGLAWDADAKLGYQLPLTDMKAALRLGAPSWAVRGHPVSAALGNVLVRPRATLSWRDGCVSYARLCRSGVCELTEEAGWPARAYGGAMG